MPKQTPLLFSFNRGEVSPQLLGRTDLEHLRLAAQIQENWQPRVLGPMQLRPGSEHIGQIASSATPGKLLPFVASFNDTAFLEFTPNQMRVWVNDAPVTRAAVATNVPTFESGYWVLTNTGATQSAATLSGLYFWYVNVGAEGRASAAITVASGDQNTEHAVRIVISHGPVRFQVGTSSTDDSIFGVETLDTGEYSLAFTPGTGTIYLTFSTYIAPENFNTLAQTQPQAVQTVTVDSITLEGPGPMVLATPWGANELAIPSLLRISQSADVIFCACQGLPQQQINRYSPTSWSIVQYKPVKGPLTAAPGDTSILLSVNTTSGDGQITSNRPFFKPSDVGTLFRLFHNQATWHQTLSFAGTHTDAIRVTGVSTVSEVIGDTTYNTIVLDRTFYYYVTAGNYQLERSFDGPTTGFRPFASASPVTDWLNNEIVYYRISLTTDGENTITFGYGGGGSGYGVCRITSLNSPTSANMEILVPFSYPGLAADWRQSEWGKTVDFPTAVALHEGRLWWAGGDRWIGSASDDYTNFDYDAIGEAAYIDIQIGKGPISQISWLLSLDSLLGGADTDLIMARSDAIQSPLTPTNLNLRFSTTTGSAPVQAVPIDNTGIYINQSGQKVFKVMYDLYSYNFRGVELSDLNPDIGYAQYVAAAIQRNPDTIVHLVRADGQIVCLLYDEENQVKAFWRKTTNGLYEDVIVLPGEIEDRVYVIVNRGGTRYVERFARLDECWGAAMNKIADAHYAYSGSPQAAFTMPWLAGQTVVAWGDGKNIGPLTLDSGGSITLSNPVSNFCVGLGYTAQFLSTKLAYGAPSGTVVNVVKRVDHIGFVLQNTHYQGIRYGSYHLDPLPGNTPNILWDQGEPIDGLPQVEKGAVVPADTVYAFYDEKRMEFAQNADTDSRIFIEAAAPLPATVVAVSFSIETEG